MTKTSAKRSITTDGKIALVGTLSSRAGAFLIQFFANPSGGDEGKTFLGQKSVTTDGNGETAFGFTTDRRIRAGQRVTATATSQGGDTSEFSDPVAVEPNARPAIAPISPNPARRFATRPRPYGRRSRTKRRISPRAT